MAKAATDDSNVTNIADPERRKLLKSRLAEVTHYHRQKDDIAAGCKDAVASIASDFGIHKKIVARMARTMYKANYSSLLEENRHFETMYETVVEGKLRDPDDLGHADPLDD